MRNHIPYKTNWPAKCPPCNFVKLAVRAENCWRSTSPDGSAKTLPFFVASATIARVCSMITYTSPGIRFSLCACLLVFEYRFCSGSRLAVAALLLRLLAHLSPWILAYDPSKPSIRISLDAVGPITTFPILLLVSQMHRCATRLAFELFRFPANILESRMRSYRNESWRTVLTSGRKNKYR